MKSNYNNFLVILLYSVSIILSLFIGHITAYNAFFNLIEVYTTATVITFTLHLFLLLTISEKNPLTFIFFVKIVVAIGSAGVLSSALSFYLPGWRFNPKGLVFSSLSILVLVYFIRIILYLFTKREKENVMIIGTGKEAVIIGEIITKAKSFFNLIGFMDYEKSHYENIDPKLVYRDIDNIEETLKKNNVNLIVMAQELEQNDNLLKSVAQMKLSGYKVVYMADFYERLTGKVPINFINNNWIIQSEFYSIYSSFFQNSKRLMDLGISIIGLVLSSPVLLLTALLIKIEDRGPIFFLQDRVGVNGKLFKIIKFRSMKVGSEKGNKYTQEGDNRITKIGNFIRKVRIDELPQFINVLKGEMSFIGPRAEWNKLVEDYEKKIPYYSIRHVVKPGITGWAQVEFRYGASIDDAFEKLQYDLYYIKHQSILLDFVIIFKTIKVVLSLGGR